MHLYGEIALSCVSMDWEKKKMYTNGCGYMTTMTATSLIFKNPQNQVADDMETWITTLGPISCRNYTNDHSKLNFDLFQKG